MVYYLVAILVFVLYIIYDINSITINSVILNKLFILGSVIYLLVNIILIYQLMPEVNFQISNLIFMMLGLFFLILEIYTLFFSLPFSDTYVSDNKANKVIKSGMYSLSRHIGVLWFILMYLFLALAFKNQTFTIFALVSCLMNLIYIIFQDKYSFVIFFDDYQQYKNEVPFLIPKLISIKKILFKGEK